MAAVRNRSNRSAWLAGLLCFAIFALGMATRPQSAPAAQAAGAARALTVERIYSYPSLSGRILRDTVWSPDGKLLTYLSDETDPGGPQIWAVDAATGQRRVLVDNQHLRNILLPPASRGQTTGLGRLTPAQYLWSPDGKALLFVSAQELFWYDLATQTSRSLVTAAEIGARRRRARRNGCHHRRRQDFARRPLGQLPARSRHLGGQRGRRRAAADHPRRQRGAAQWRTRLGLSRGAGHLHGVLVVARLRENRVSAARRKPRRKISPRG